jgi:hypothetical protein
MRKMLEPAKSESSPYVCIPWIKIKALPCRAFYFSIGKIAYREIRDIAVSAHLAKRYS